MATTAITPVTTSIITAIINHYYPHYHTHVLVLITVTTEQYVQRQFGRCLFDICGSKFWMFKARLPPHLLLSSASSKWRHLVAFSSLHGAATFVGYFGCGANNIYTIDYIMIYNIYIYIYSILYHGIWYTSWKTSPVVNWTDTTRWQLKWSSFLRRLLCVQ